MKHTDSWLGAAAGLLLAAACGDSRDRMASVATKYDPNSGRLSQVTLNAARDGKPDVFSYMDGSAFIRIEIDNDEDGKIDRWEHYGASQKLEKVGISRSNDGKADAWIFAGPDGIVDRIEVSTRRNGVPNRIEYYLSGRIARAEEDTNADGRVDKWETYTDDALATVAFDTTNSGKPTMTLDYRAEGRGATALNEIPPR